MNVERELKEIVASVLEKHPGIFLVSATHDKQKHEIVIDGDQALGIYDISAISREINHLADERMPDENYSLDIASPGADSDMLLLRQYPKHTGREFRVVLSDDSAFKGKLLEVNGDELRFEAFASEKPKRNEKPEERSVKHSDIKQANIIISFK